MRLEIKNEDSEPHAVRVARRGDSATIWIGDRFYQADLRRVGRAWDLSVGDRVERVWLFVEHDTVYVNAFGRAWKLEVFDPVERSLRVSDQQDTITAPMPGTVVSIAADDGESVSIGQTLLVIESMKMQSEMTAWRDGTVERIHRQVGETFDRGDALIALVPEGADEEDD